LEVSAAAAAAQQKMKMATAYTTPRDVIGVRITPFPF
jgi:hypothetical protein